MPILARLGAVSALSILAACVQSNSDGSDPVPVDMTEVLAAAATFTPTYDGDDVTGNGSAESEAGISGLIGLDDGTVVPINLKIDREANTLSITYGENDPIVLTNGSEDGSSGNWSNEAMSIYAYGGSDYFYFYETMAYSTSANFNLMTHPDDLPTSGEVGYTGNFNMRGGETNSYGNLSLAVDFGASTVTGGLIGSLSDGHSCCFLRVEEGPGSEGPEGDSFFGALDGTVSNGLLAAGGTVNGTVSGDVSLLGGFTDEGQSVQGGIAGTIDGTTMGGQFYAGSGGYYD